MSQLNPIVKARTDEAIRELKKYAVVLLNDDFTPMDFVVMILETVFFKTPVEAETLMKTVHNRGEATVGLYTYDIAVSKAEKAMRLARDNNFPLRAEVRETL